MPHEVPEEHQPDVDAAVVTKTRKRRVGRPTKAETQARLRNPVDSPITGYYDWLQIVNRKPGMVYELISAREAPRKQINGYIAETWGDGCAYHAWVDTDNMKDGEPIKVKGELTLMKTTVERKAQIDEYDRRAYKDQRALMQKPQPSLLVGVS